MSQPAAGADGLRAGAGEGLRRIDGYGCGAAFSRPRASASTRPIPR